MTYYHGSYNYLPEGTILKPKENYKEYWSQTDFYNILEKYRPQHMLAHHDSVFMCKNDNDIDNAGGGTEWLFIIQPGSRIEKHDMYWCSEISIALHNDKHEEILKELAKKYWQGVKSNEPLWEYLTPSAIIIKVEEF